MATTDIQIVNLNNFEKIQNFLNDSRYKEILENSEMFNTKTNVERRLRLPFLDPQTGVAQTHCTLFMKQTERMPGFREGQIYTYPSKRWHKPKRQYMLHHQSYKAYQFRETQYIRSQPAESSGLSSDGNSMSAIADTDSKDSHRNDEDTKWYYDEMELTHVDDFEDDIDSDHDFDESYMATTPRGRRKRTRGNSRKNNADGAPTPAKRGRGGGRGRGEGSGRGRGRGRGSSNSANAVNSSTTASSAVASSTSSLSISTTSAPIISTNPVVSISTASTSISTTSSPNTTPVLSTTTTVPPIQTEEQMSSALTPESKIQSGEDSSDGLPLLAPPASPIPAASSILPNTTPLPTPSSSSVSSSKKGPKPRTKDNADRKENAVESPKEMEPEPKEPENEKATPSPYCDFCLGDAQENKKTNLPEELVSCSDCGRSGHPTCLQFTENMIVSVKRYRWQCIECKYCSICGTSDNDDQLLFCDDCDRGYHMYCLAPPLTSPPEGSWSCKLCIEEFHNN